MPLTSFSTAFIDWIRARIIAHSCDLLPETQLFDERSLSLESMIRKSLESSLGYGVGVSLPTAHRVQHTDSPDDTVHRLTCTVAIFRGSLASLSQEQSIALAESLYLAFCGASYVPVPGSCRPDVFADSFTAQVIEEKGAIITFEVSIDLDLDHINH